MLQLLDIIYVIAISYGQSITSIRPFDLLPDENYLKLDLGTNDGVWIGGFLKYSKYFLIKNGFTLLNRMELVLFGNESWV